jgi:hypothetical protein
LFSFLCDIHHNDCFPGLKGWGLMKTIHLHLTPKPRIHGFFSHCFSHLGVMIKHMATELEKIKEFIQKLILPIIHLNIFICYFLVPSSKVAVVNYCFVFGRSRFQVLAQRLAFLTEVLLGFPHSPRCMSG